MFFPERMDSASLFLTANCDTVYFWGFIDLSDGPMVLDMPAPAPPGAARHDRRHVVPLGHRPRPGRPRPRGGGSLPARWAWLRRSAPRQWLPRLPRPHHTGDPVGPGIHGRQRSQGPGRRDPERCPPLPLRAGYPGHRGRHVPCGEGSLGGGPSGARDAVHRSFGGALNTIYPNDFRYWEIVNELVQQEPPGAGDPELLGLLAAVEIVHGKHFDPGERMRKILEEAVIVGNATARAVRSRRDQRTASPSTRTRRG